MDEKQLLQQIDTLEAQLQETENRLTLANVELAERDRTLAEIRTSTGWALLTVLWRIRTRVVPPASARDRLLFRSLSAARASLDSLSRARKKFIPGGKFKASQQAPPVRVEIPAFLTIPPRPRPRRYDVIVLPIIDWHFRYQRPQQLASRFGARGHRVFYVSATFQSGDTALVRSLARGVVEVQLPGPVGMSIYSGALSERWRELQAYALSRVAAQLGIEDGVCMVDLPFWAPLAFQLRDQLGWQIVYDCMDDHAGFGNVHPQMFEAEELLISRSDVLLVTSHHLLDRVRTSNPAAVLVPNAADFEHFRFAPPVRPSDLPSIGQPIVGYYGAISEWFDADLLLELARARPDWQFVLVGNSVGGRVASLRRLANVHLLGERPYATLPAYLHAFDVCLIPFVKTRLTDATNPVKLFEYLSAGKPVVASNLDEIRHYDEYLKIASTPGEWLDAIKASLASVDLAAAEQRIAFARQNSWEERVQTIDTLMTKLYGRASVIVVTYNNLNYNRLCLQSIYTKTNYPDFEVIVVDNNSTDGTREFLKEFEATHPDMRVILNDSNAGFAAANNQGLDIATGEYVVFLNNDTIVTPGWLSRLIYHLRDPSIGMVGPVTNWSGNESKIDVPYTSAEDIDAFAAEHTQKHAGEQFDIQTLALFCVAMRRATVETVGRLDERFGIGMFEDDDYALRVHQLGLRVVCAEDVFIHHWGRASFARLDQDFYRNLFDENRRKFEEKWGRAWEPHRARVPGDALARATSDQ